MRFYVVTIMLGVAAAVLVALLLLPYLWDLAPTPDALAANIKSDTGLAAEIDGAVVVRLLPRPHIAASKVRLRNSQKNSKQNNAAPRFIAEIDTLRIALPLRRLFSKAAKLTDIVAIGGQVDIFTQARNVNLLSILEKFSSRAVRGQNLDVRVHGLAQNLPQNDPQMALQLQGVNADFSRSLWGNAHRAQLSGRFYDRPFNIDLTTAAAIDRARLSVSLAASFDNSEQLSFAGFVGIARDFVADKKSDFIVDGEIAVRSSQQVPQMMHALGLQLGTGTEATAHGLIYLDNTQLRSDSLEVTMFGTDFAAKIDSLFADDGGVDKVLVRLNTNFVNLDIFSRLLPDAESAPDAESTPQSPTLYTALAPFFALPRLNVQMTATRFLLGGEAGRNLQLDIATTGENIAQNLTFERFSADMPFNSSILGNGVLVYDASGEKLLRGIMSVRSSDALAATQWLGRWLQQGDMPQLARLNAQKFQRLSFVSDFTLSATTRRLDNLTGRLGDLPFNLDFAVNADRTIMADFEIARLDMDDWGMTPENVAFRQPKSRNVFVLGNLVFDTALRGLLAAPLANYQINLQAKTPQLLVGVDSFGSFSVAAHSTGDRVHITNMQIDNLNGIEAAVSGQLGHDGKQLSGGLTLQLMGDGASALTAPILARLNLLKIDLSVPLEIAILFNFTSPDSDAWPNILTQGQGRLGDIAVAFDASIPSRRIDFDEVGSRARLTLVGKANALAARFSLPPQYADQSGRLVLDYNVQGAAISNLTAQLKLAQDVIALDGVIRPVSGGRQLTGSIAVQMRDLFPIILGAKNGAKNTQMLPMHGQSQLTVTDETAGFSNIDFRLGSGRLSGEGLFDMRRKRPALNASLMLQDFDATAFLPIFTPDKGWSQSPTDWALLGLSDADMQARFNNLRFGKMQLDSVVARLKLVEGVLEAPDLAITAWGGQGVFDVQAVGGDLPPALTVNGKFSAVNLASWLTQIYGRPLIDVGFDGAVELHMRGLSPAEIMRSTSGTLRLDGNNGHIDFFNLAGFGKQTASTASVESFAQQGGTKFARVLGLANINKGVINSDSAELIIDGDERFADLKAVLDLTRLQSSAELRFYPLDEKRALIYRLSGAIASPKITLDVSAFGDGAFAKIPVADNNAKP